MASGKLELEMIIEACGEVKLQAEFCSVHSLTTLMNNMSKHLT